MSFFHPNPNSGVSPCKIGLGSRAWVLGFMVRVLGLEFGFCGQDGKPRYHPDVAGYRCKCFADSVNFSRKPKFCGATLQVRVLGLRVRV